MIESSLSDLAVRARIKTLASPASLSNLPSCLKSRRIWYPFKFTPRANGSIGEAPCDRQGTLATGWQDPSTCMSFDDAYGLQADGVGIVIHEELGLTGIDFDHCVTDGVITDPWVAQKIQELDSYTEYSVSGTGVHVLVWGRRPGVKCGGGRIEMYDGVPGSRFFTMSGNRVPGTPAEIRSAQGTIDALYFEVFRADDGKTSPQQNQQVSPNPNNSFHGKKKRKGNSSKKGSAGGEMGTKYGLRGSSLRIRRFGSTT